MAGTISFHKLHDIIQIVMGWENYHLYEFSAPGFPLLELPEDCEDSSLHYRRIAVKDVLTSEKQKLRYLYDFGDGWQHTIVVEKIIEKDPAQKAPVCIGGQRSCPPEDSGGTGGYQRLLTIRKNKKHAEYNELIVNWLGEGFDPEAFDIGRVNAVLQRMK